MAVGVVEVMVVGDMGEVGSRRAEKWNRKEVFARAAR